MNADEVAKVYYYAGETRAVLLFVAIIAITGFCVGAYMTILYWIVKAKLKRRDSQLANSNDQVMKLKQKIGHLNEDQNNAIQIRADAEFLKSQYTDLDAQHDLLKANFDIVNANYEELRARALRYRQERNKSDDKLRDTLEIHGKVVRRTAALIEHVDLPLEQPQVKT